MDLSIVIVNWNTRDLLRACLHSLRDALEGSTVAAEILVVDNASSDGSVAMVEADFPEVRLFANAENRNYAAGNNQGIRAGRGEFVLLLNPDTVVPRDGIESLVAALRQNPKWGAVAPALIHPDGRIQDSVRGFPTPRAIVGELTGLARFASRSEWGAYRARALSSEAPTLVDQPMASAFLVRRDALVRLGLFDEAFPLFFNDVDLCFRLKQARWEIAYDPRVRVVHVGGASTRQVRPDAILKSHAGLRRFYEKHYRRHVNPVTFALITALIQWSGWVRAGLARASKP